MTAPDPRRCGWMADQPDGQTCGEPAVVAVAVRVFFPTNTLERTEHAGLMLCERHNFAAREAE